MSYLVRKTHTLHFDIGKIGTPSVAPTPGTPDPDALSEFGQLNIPFRANLQYIHLHIIKGASSVDVSIEVYRRRSSVFTLLTTLSASGTVPNYYTDSGTISDAVLESGDYLYAQATAATLGLAGGVDGFTVDMHFEQA